MDATTYRRKSRCTTMLLLAVVAASGLFTSRSAAASAMNKTLHARSQHAQAVALARYDRAEQALSNYYARALATHRLNVIVPPALRNIQSDQGLLHESSFVAYLEWRRSLAPARFDFYHPLFAQAILTDQQVRPTVPTEPQYVIPSSDPPINPASGGVSPPPGIVIPPVATPEPSSLMIAGVLIGAGIWARSGVGRAGRSFLRPKS